MSEESRPRVLLADDHSGILRVLQRILEPSCDVVGSVTEGSAVLAETKKLSPDVVVMDVSLRDVDGLDVCREIKGVVPQTKVIIITAANDAEISQKALSVGASAFVLKHRMAEELVNAIEKAHTDSYSSVA